MMLAGYCTECRRFKRVQMTVAEETVTLEFLAKLVQKSLEEGRQHRKAMLKLKQLHVAQYETIKMELGGALANMQTTIENSLGRIEDKVDELARKSYIH